MLAGDLANAAIDTVSMDQLTNGLDQVAVWSDSVEQHTPFSTPLSLVTTATGDRITVGSSYDLSQAFEDLIAGPVRTQLEATDVVERDTDSVVTFLNTLPYVTSADAGMSNLSNELRFDVSFNDQIVLNELAIDLGAGGEALGVELTEAVNADLTVDVDYRLSFGVLLDPHLSDEQAFFLRDSSLEFDSNLHVTSVASSAHIGVVEATATIDSLDLDAALTLDFIDVVADPQQNITLQELNGFDVQDIVNVSIGDDIVDASVSFSPIVGSWTDPAVPSLSINAPAIGEIDPAISTSNFAELDNFTQIAPNDLRDGFVEVQGFLSNFSLSNSMAIDLPFLDGQTLADSVDVGEALTSMLNQMIDANGDLTFNSLAEFESLLGVTVDYDAQTDQLIVPVSATAPTIQTTADVAFEGSVGPIANVEANGQATVDASGVVSFNLTIDLSLPNSPLVDRVGVSDMQVNAVVDYAAAGNVSGELAYGMVASRTRVEAFRGRCKSLPIS